MSNTRSIILTILAVVSIAFALIQQSKVSDLFEELEAVKMRARTAEMEALRQRDAAEESRTVAARRQMEAEEALRDCQNKKR